MLCDDEELTVPSRTADAGGPGAPHCGRGGGPSSAAAICGLAALVAWTDGRWAQAPEHVWASSRTLCPCQRLVLGLVVFGRLRYTAVAARTGLPAATVSVLCAAALRQLRPVTGDPGSSGRATRRRPTHEHLAWAGQAVPVPAAGA